MFIDRFWPMSAHTLFEQWQMLNAREFVLVWLSEGVHRRHLWRLEDIHTCYSCISYTHTHARTHAHTHTHTHTHTYTHTRTHTHTHTGTHAHAHAHMHIHIHNTHIYIFIHYMIYIYIIYHRLSELPGAVVYDPCRHNPCKNGGQCTKENDDTYSCNCLESYYGKKCDGKSRCDVNCYSVTKS